MKTASQNTLFVNATLWATIFVTISAPITGHGTSAKTAAAKGPATVVLFEAQQSLPRSTSLPFVRTDALLDPKKKITKDFHVPESLRKRTEFWFDIYTKYGSDDHVIHHTLYPWIVFSVADTSPINSNKKLHKWTRYHRAKAYASNEFKNIRATLLSLSKRKSYTKLSPLEQSLYDALREVKGRRATVFKEAANNTRTQLGQKDFITAGLSRSQAYMPAIEKMFKDAGVPVELSRMPFVESSFNEKAESKVGASGIWQIMPGTGKMYLKVTDHIDERNSPLKATAAAIEILKDNKRILGQWDFAVSAYNHGPYGIRRVIKKTNATNMPELIDRQYGSSFQFASANFYPSFLAILHAYTYKSDIYKKNEITPRPIFRHSTLALNKSMRAKDLTRLAGLSKDQLLEFNYDLHGAIKNNALIPSGFKIFVPQKTQPSLDRKLFKEAAIELKRKTRS